MFLLLVVLAVSWGKKKIIKIIDAENLPNTTASVLGGNLDPDILASEN